MPETTENAIPLTEIYDVCIQQKKSRLFILREDLIHPKISGNKWRKLKYNIIEAKEKGFDTLLTFGGAFSNHIAATAAAGKKFGLKTIGVIRGEEVLPINPTLELAQKNGMIFKYLSREEYRNKTDEFFINQLKEEFRNAYIIPEGGSNALAVKGCAEIVENIDIDYDVICCACGTGGTLAGIISSTRNEVLGFPALKGGGFLIDDIEKLLSESLIKKRDLNWKLITDYHFGGYAKIKPELIDFIKDFKKDHHILLDLIYTGKMLFGLFDMIKNTTQLDNKKIIVVHTGGLQGNKGFEERFGIVL